MLHDHMQHITHHSMMILPSTGCTGGDEIFRRIDSSRLRRIQWWTGDPKLPSKE